MPLIVNTPHESHVNTGPFPLIKTNTTLFRPKKSKKSDKLFYKPNASQVIHFAIQPIIPLNFQTSDKEVKIHSTPHTYFNTRFNSTFNSLQVYKYAKSETNSFSVIIGKITHHSEIRSPKSIDYIEVPATNIKPLHYKVHDGNSLIHTPFFSYCSDLSEPKFSVRRFALRKN